MVTSGVASSLSVSKKARLLGWFVSQSLRAGNLSFFPFWAPVPTDGGNFLTADLFPVLKATNRGSGALPGKGIELGQVSALSSLKAGWFF